MSGRIWLWSLAALAALIVLWVSFDLFLLAALIAAGIRIAVLHSQRDEVAAKWADELFAKAGLKHKVKLLTAVNVRLLDANEQLREDQAAIVARLAEVLDEHASCPAPVVVR